MLLSSSGMGFSEGGLFLFFVFYVCGKYIGVGIPYCCLSIKKLVLLWLFI